MVFIEKLNFFEKLSNQEKVATLIRKRMFGILLHLLGKDSTVVILIVATKQF